MATSGSKTIYLSDSQSMALKFSWSQTSQSIANNTTTISWKLQLISNAYAYISSTASKDWSVTINGTKYSGTNTVGINTSSTKTLASGTTTIVHNDDGTKSFSYSFTQEFAITFSGTNIASKSGSGTGTLNTIPRGSTLGTISNFTLGNAITIPITKHSSSFTDSLTISLNGKSIKTVSNISNGASVSFTTSELETIYSSLPSSTTGTFTFKLTTKSGSTTIGTSSKSAVGTIPSSVKPSISNVAVSEANTSVIPSSWGVFVQNKSKIKFVTTSSGSYGSTISSVKVSFNGAAYNGATVTTGVIATSGTLNATITVTDSRGRTASTTKSITVLAYAKPYLTTFTVARSDSNGTANASGSYAKVTFNGGVTSLNSKNTYSFVIKYKKTSESSFTTKTVTSSSNTVNTSVILSGIDTESSYDFVGEVNDYFTKTTANRSLASAFVTMDYLNGGKGISFGKVAELTNYLDVSFNMLTRKYIDLANDLGIRGVKTDGTPIALLGISSTNNTVLGYGGYANEIGQTNIYGNGIYLYTKKEIVANERMIIPNNKGYCCYKTDGGIQSLIMCNTNNNVAVGYGSNLLKLLTNSFGVELIQSTESAYDGYFRPTVTNRVTLGTTANRWYRLYQYITSIDTSDEREKYDIKPIEEFSKTKTNENVLETLFNRLIPKTYYMNDEVEKQFHIGFVAQDIAKVLDELGIDEKDIGLLSHEYYVDEETGKEKDVYGLGYSEFIALNTYMIQKQQKEIDELKKQVEELTMIVKGTQ